MSTYKNRNPIIGRQTHSTLAKLRVSLALIALFVGLAARPHLLAEIETQPSEVTVAITSASPNPAWVGETVTIQVKVSANDPLAGTPSGAVFVKSGDNQVCQITLDAFGEGQCSLTFDQYGILPLKAVYPGEVAFLPGVSQTHFLEIKTLNVIQVVYTHDFETPAGSEWCDTRREATPTGGRKFLGRFSNETVCLALHNLPQHAFINLSFDLYIISSWNGNQVESDLSQPGLTLPAIIVGPDRWRFSADGNIMLDTTFSNFLGHPQAYPGQYPTSNYPSYTGAEEMNSLGYNFGNKPADAVYHLEFVFGHIVSTLQLDFTALGLQYVENESWGLDNVVVKTGYVDAPYKLFLPILAR